MSKNSKSVTDMLDYVRQLRRHTEGRRAIHVKLSGLEKHFREEHYRRFVASALRPLITKFGATMFALPNTDVVLMVKDASVDTIDPLLNNIRRKYKDSELVASIDAIQGVSDAFVGWFDLEEEYADFLDYVQTLADGLLSETPDAKEEETQAPRKRTPGLLEIKSRPVERLKPSKKLKMVAVEPEKANADVRDLDVELLHSVTNALQAADVTNMIRRQQVMAILGSQAAQPVMVHRFIPLDVVFDTLLETKVQALDTGLKGYLESFLSSRLLAMMPNMHNEQSLASSLRISCESVSTGNFDEFDKSLGSLQRSAVVIELSAMDLMANYDLYIAAYEKLDRLGYKISVADLDPRMLLWMDYSDLRADFVKLRRPAGASGLWLANTNEKQLKERIQKIGFARIILDGCENKSDIEAGQQLGITLFQGEAADPVTSTTL